MDRVLMNRKEVATYLSVPVSRIDSLMRQGKIPCVRFPGTGQEKRRTLRFEKSSIDVWVTEYMRSA